MIVVRRPTSPGTAASSAFGQLAASLLRKHGWVSVREDAVADGLAIVPQDAEGRGDHDDPIGVFDGPISPRRAAAFGLATDDRTAGVLEVFDAERRELGTLCHPRFEVRAIPLARGVRSDPYLLQAEDGRWNRDFLRFQTIDGGDRWRPLLWGRAYGSDESLRPVAVGDGSRIVLGIPLLEIAIALAAFPALAVGFWAHQRCPSTFGMEVWLADAIEALALDRGVPAVRARRWPNGCRAALTIRHDYDRLIDDGTLGGLLASYAALGVRSSWGFLIDKAPRPHAQRIESAGHEIMLHSVAGNERSLRAEIDALQAATSVRPLGSTAHGGLGAPGYLGEHHFRWAESVAFSYTEVLGQPLGVPAQAIVIDGGVPRATRVLLPNQHLSLDLTTKPDGHALTALRSSVPAAIDRGEHVVIMNHPDIHREELLALLTETPRDAVWSATFRELAAWTNAVKFEADVDADCRTVRFGAPLPAPATMAWLSGDGSVRETVAPAGTRVGRPTP